MKAERKGRFTPVIITLETQKELDFFRGFLNAGPEGIKSNCSGYDEQLDHDFWAEIKEFR